MANPSLIKKLQPAKKALKRLTKALQTKLHNLNLPKAIKVVKTNTRHFLAYCSVHLILPFKKLSITKPPYRRRRWSRTDEYSHAYNFYGSKNQVQKSILPIYIDQLYASESSSGSMQARKQNLHRFHAETSGSSSTRGKEVVKNGGDCDQKGFSRNVRINEKEEKGLYSVEDAWREVVAKSPQLRPVDERADEFISRFRQEMQLQKEKSALEFEERLARSI